MLTFISGFIKDILIGLAILVVGFVMNFDWFFWLLVLVYVMRPFIDAATHSLNRLSEKLDNYNKNRPPQ